ncbi:hypothetical protein VKT23_015797 [Stygiomarasmius scandens]
MIAKSLSINGAKVYITGRRLEVLQKTTAELSNYGFIPLQMDVTDKGSIHTAVQVIEQAEGKLDILVNNAGITGTFFPFVTDRSSPQNANMGDSLFAQDTFDEWAEVYHTNTAGPFFVTMGFLSLLKRGACLRKGETSSVINISSGCGLSNLSMGYFNYGCTKAAIHHLTKAMATEFGLSRIPVRVNCISPGVFPSQLAGTADQVAKWITEVSPGAVNVAPALRAGREEEIGMAAVLLSSSAGEFINGIIMPIDGGHDLVNP